MTLPIEILLVEDNEGDVEMILEVLQEETSRYHVSVTNNGTQALDHLLKRGNFPNAPTPRLILLDLNMPGTDGKMLLEIIKWDKHLMTIPVVVLTSSKAPSDIREAYVRHANCYVTKRFDSKEFKNAIKQIVNFWMTLAVLPGEEPARQIRTVA